MDITFYNLCSGIFNSAYILYFWWKYYCSRILFCKVPSVSQIWPSFTLHPKQITTSVKNCLLLPTQMKLLLNISKSNTISRILHSRREFIVQINMLKNTVPSNDGKKYAYLEPFKTEIRVLIKARNFKFWIPLKLMNLCNVYNDGFYFK